MDKLKLLRGVALLLASNLANPIFAQTSSPMTMNLEQCLSYAKEHSITLQQAQLAVENTVVDESSAKSAFLPSISASVSQGFTNSPFTSGDTSNKYSGSYGADLSMTLFNGGENVNTLKQSKLSTEIAILGVDEKEDILEIGITQLYVEILYTIEQIEVIENSIALSQKNLERGALLLEVGSINKADFALLESAEASEQYNLVSAQSSLRNKYVQLKHLLDISNDTLLEVDSSQITSATYMGAVPAMNEVYASALDNRPEIKASSLSVESSLLSEKIARSGYLPTVSLSAGVGINHISGTNYTFGYQLKNNYSNAIGLNVSVPIFSRFSTRNSVTKAQNNTKLANLSYTDNTKTLYQTIESLHTNAINAQAMYMVSQSKLKAFDRSLQLVTEQYNLGMKNIIELLTEQDSFRESSQEYLESKYTLMLNKALLEYYQTGIIKL